MKMLLPFRRLRIYQKVVFIYIILLIPICIIAVFINITGSNYIKNQITKSVLSNIDFYSKQFEDEMARIRTQQYQMVNNVDAKSLSFNFSLMNEFEKAQTTDRINERLGTVGYSSVYIRNVGVYVKPFGKTISFKNGLTDIPNEEYIALKQCFKLKERFSFCDYSGRLFLIETDYQNRAKEMQDVNIACFVELSGEKIRETLDRIKLDTDSGVMLADNNGKVLVKTDSFNIDSQKISKYFREKNNKGSGVFDIYFNGHKYWIAYSKCAFQNATVFAYFPDSGVMGPLKNFNLLFLILSIISVITIGVFSLLINLMVHKPMHKVLDSLGMIEQGNLDIVIHHNRDDEYMYLYKGVNNMVERLKAYIKLNFEQKLELQRSEFKQLQSQINPHFLYNCFFNISKMCKYEDSESAMLLAQKLGSYYRYITRNGMDDVPFHMEYSHAVDYVEIQNIRFMRRIKVVMDNIPDECRDITVPRIILQPVLENAFEHAFEKNPDEGIIYVTINYKSGILKIVIEDNGMNLSNKSLEKLKSDLSRAESVIEKTGIINVCRRIQLKYGEKSGIFVSRSSYGGLKAEVIINTNRG